MMIWKWRRWWWFWIVVWAAIVEDKHKSWSFVPSWPLFNSTTSFQSSSSPQPLIYTSSSSSSSIPRTFLCKGECFVQLTILIKSEPKLQKWTLSIHHCIVVVVVISIIITPLFNHNLDSCICFRKIIILLIIIIIITAAVAEECSD